MDEQRTPPIVYDPIRWKAGLLIAVFFFLLSIVIGRLFWVQVVEGARYRELAKKQYESRVQLRADRGRFFDRKGRDVAGMMRTTSFAADPVMLKHPELLSQLLASATKDSAQNYLRKIRSTKGRFVWLARGVNSVLYPDLDTLLDPGLIRVSEPKRNFYYGPIAAQVLGTTDVDNNGLSGLELQYDNILRGESGFVVMQRDGRGRLRPGVNPERKSPRNGNGLELTLDIEFQRVVEQELRQGIRASGAESGTVVAIEPSTGDILAIATYPSFDPNRLDKADPSAIRIRAVTDQYEPGSTMKAITAAALLEEEKIAPNDRVDGRGGLMQIPGHVIRDDHPMGVSTFQIAMEQSSNVVFATASRMLDDRTYYKYVRDFGFGIPTGIDLPGEIRGILKKPNEFGENTKLFMSYGYELSATALQVLVAYATIANGGVMMQPRCVRSIRTPDGTVVSEIKPQVVRRVISERTSQLLTDMLTGVVERGTGTGARIPGVKIAGKTGTAQQLVGGLYSQQAYTASFVGYYPANSPRVAMIVMLNKPTTSIYGGTTAAPIFRRIVQKTMTMLELDAGVVEKIAASAEADSVVVPDIRGLVPTTADTMLQHLGLRLEAVSDTGIIIQQTPEPGRRVERSSTVKTKIAPGPAKQRPDVTGLTLRRAIAVLHHAGAEVKVTGTGRVVQQTWSGTTCTLVAR